MSLQTEVICTENDPNAGQLVQEAIDSGKYLRAPFVSGGNYLGVFIESDGDR